MAHRDGRFDYLKIAEIVARCSSWKQSLDEIVAEVYSSFIFDNLALYVVEKEENPLTEIAYARAVGRGRGAGADASWGVEIASQVMEKNEILLQQPEELDVNANRLDQVFLLGVPLRTSAGLHGVAVFVRFGGPTYTDEHINQARFIAAQFSVIFEQKKLKESIGILEEARYQLSLDDDFIATISHELRTPLGFIKGYSTSLLRRDAQWDEATRMEFLSIIDEEADHLAGLIENMLDSARLQSRTLPMKFQPVRLDMLIMDVTSLAVSRFKNLQYVHDISIRPTAMIDQMRMLQVFNNLFSNAVKYAPGALVSIALAEIPGYYQITFSDTGPGIATENLSHIFTRFFRAPGQNGSGSGLGLFICQRILEAHGGRMSVESRPGRGTTFILDLPVLPSN